MASVPTEFKSAIEITTKIDPIFTQENRKMSSFPSEVWVLGQRFTIDHGEIMRARFIRDLDDPKEKERWGKMVERMLHEGVCNLGNHGDTPYIAVKAEMDEQYQRGTAMHELVHAVDGLLAGFHHLNEEVVQRWGQGLFAVLTDPRNRRFVEWVLGVKFCDHPTVGTGTNKGPRP
jgi:hypothetical protein